MFFWVKCKMKYSRTSRGCTSAGFYGNYRAVFSAVVSLRLALCYQLGEEGRVRTIPKRAKQKVGQHHRQIKSFSLRRDHVMNSLPCFMKLLLTEGTYNQMYNSQRCNRHHFNFCSFKSASCLKANVGENGRKV